MSGQRVSQSEDSFHISCSITAHRRPNENEPCFVAGNTLDSDPSGTSRRTDIERIDALARHVTRS